MANKGKGRAASGGGSISKIKVNRNGKSYNYWTGRITVGYDSNGKQVQKSVSAKTQKEVLAKMKALEKELSSIPAEVALNSDAKQMTMENWMTLWSTEYLNHVAESTAYEYIHKCRHYICPALGKIKLNKLTPLQVQRFINKLSADKDHGGLGLSPKFVKDIYGVLHKALDQAVTLNYIGSNPCSRCSLPRVTAPELKLPSQNDLVKLLKAISGHKHENYYKLLMFTGMREAEALGLTWDCVDLDNNIILIKQQLLMRRGKEERRLGPTKNKKSRTIVIPAFLADILRNQKAREDEKATLFGNAWKNLNLVFSNDVGDYLSRQTVYTCFKRVLETNDIPDLTIHSLRHAYASLAFANGDDPKTVQTNLGHATSTFTLNVYAYSTPEMLRGSADRMNERYRQLLSE